MITNNPDLLRPAAAPAAAVREGDGAPRPIGVDIAEAAFRAKLAHDWEECAKLCAALEPTSRHSASVMKTYGQALCSLGDHSGGLERLLQAAALEPNDGETHAVLGAAYGFLGEGRKSREHHDHALRLAVDIPIAHWNRALHRLNEGDFAEGWAEYEWGRVHGGRPTRSVQPQWDGGYLGGDAKLYIWAEQGYGDTIQFVRLVEQAKRRSGATVILEVQPLLLPLLYDFPYADVVVASEPCGSFRYAHTHHCALMSLPYIFGWQSPSDIPPFEIYVKPKSKVTNRTDAPNEDVTKVGLCWRGSSTHATDDKRSMSIEDVRPLLDMPKTAFISLLKGADIPAGTPIGVCDLRDWSDTAAVIDEMDVVVSVDTAVAHLAGAMGKHVILMVAEDNDWRWMKARSDSPWYPSMLIVRQTKRGDWTSVVKEVRAALRDMFRPFDDESDVGPHAGEGI